MSISTLGIAVLAGCQQPISEQIQDSTTAQQALEAIAESLPDYRSSQARLTSGFEWAPCEEIGTDSIELVPRACSTPPASGSPEHQHFAELGLAVSEAVTTLPADEAAHLLGVWGLLWPNQPGRVDLAVQQLESAVAEDPTNPARLNDLAVAYLNRAWLSNEPAGLFLALDSLERASGLDPESAETIFNQALALETLQLGEMALEAWGRYLDVESDPHWRAEAEQRITEVAEQLRQTDWEKARQELLEALDSGDEQATRAIVARFPSAAREMVWAELLPAWGDRYLADEADQATEILTQTQKLAVVVADLTGETMPLDTVEVVEETYRTRTPQSALTRLAEAHRTFAAAFILYEARRFSESVAGLERSRDLFVGSESPLAGWPGLYLSVTEYSNGDLDEAATRLQELRDRHQDTGHSTLLGTVYWMLGLIEAERMALSDSLRFYSTGLDYFVAVHQRSEAASQHNLIADNLEILGDFDSGWRHMFAALALSGHVSKARRLNAIYSEAMQYADLFDLPRVAARLAELSVEASIASGDPELEGEALLERAALRQELGQVGAAKTDLELARSLQDRITDPDRRNLLTARVYLTEGRLNVASEPETALVSLTRSLEYFGQGEAELLRAEILHDRGRGHRSLGRMEAAETDFLQAIGYIESGRQQIDLSRQRVSYFDQSIDVFGDLVSLYIEQGGRYELAFEIAERARAKELLDIATPSRASGHLQALTAAEVQHGLPPGVSIAYYVVLADQLLVWTITSDSTEFGRTPILEPELTAMVIEAQSAIHIRGEAPNEERSSTELYRLLIKPVVDRVPADATLVIVPDKALHFLPFSSLRNPKTGRFLVEERTLVISPSASLLMAGFEEHKEAGQKPLTSALIVANPKLDRREFPDLPSLAQAENTAAEIASLYPSAEVLVGEDATKSRFVRQAGRFDVVHFAGHAISNPRRYLWSRMALASEDPDEQSGSLYAHEILAAGLDKTKVMVLAACRTGSGPLMGGEGMMSLARPFLAEGVPSVVVTLTNVDDLTTAELSQLFHGHLVATGDPAFALRRAQLDMLASPDPRRQSPAAWAPFQIVGSPVKWKLQVE